MTKRKSGTAQPIGTQLGAMANGVAPDAAFIAREQRMEQVRNHLSRGLNGMLDRPRTCGDRACRRARACVGRGMSCQRHLVPLPPDPEKDAEAMQKFRDILREYARRRGLRCL